MHNLLCFPTPFWDGGRGGSVVDEIFTMEFFYRRKRCNINFSCTNRRRIFISCYFIGINIQVSMRVGAEQDWGSLSSPRLGRWIIKHVPCGEGEREARWSRMLSANRRVSLHKVELVAKEMMTDYDTELKMMFGGEATRRKTGACFWIAMRSTEWISYCYGLAFACWPVIKPVVTMVRLVAQKIT